MTDKSITKLKGKLTNFKLFKNFENFIEKLLEK